jgi:hypothetical protein
MMRRLISFALIGFLAILALVACADAETPQTAPAPLFPADGSVFVDSNLTLLWDWKAGLADNQSFALRLWYADEPYKEVWLKQTTFNARDFIDSYSRDVGPFHWQVAVVNHSATGFESMGSQWSPLQTLNRVRRISPTPYPDELLSPMARFIRQQKFDSTTEMIDFIRHFIRTNTTTDGQAEYKPDFSDALDQIMAYTQGTGEMPYLECSGRSTAMHTLLKELGIESRLIFLYQDVPGYIGQHTTLEVFNPDTQMWEIHDLSVGTYLMDSASGMRVSAERLTFGSLDTIVACDYEGNCSAEQAAPTIPYFEAFRYGHTNEFWVNPDRFDVSKRFEGLGNVNLAEFITGNPRDFVFHFDNWEK